MKLINADKLLHDLVKKIETIERVGRESDYVKGFLHGLKDAVDVVISHRKERDI